MSGECGLTSVSTAKPENVCYRKDHLLGVCERKPKYLITQLFPLSAVE